LTARTLSGVHRYIRDERMISRLTDARSQQRLDNSRVLTLSVIAGMKTISGRNFTRDWEWHYVRPATVEKKP